MVTRLLALGGLAARRLCGLLRLGGLFYALRRLARPELGCRGTRGFGLLQAGAQRLHQVDDLALAFGGDLRNRDFGALHLLLDGRLDPSAQLVLVGCWVERVRCLLSY